MGSKSVSKSVGMIHVFWSLLFLIVYNFDKNEEIPESDKMLGIKIDKSAQI